MNRVPEDEKRGTGFSSEETRSLWKHPTSAEGHDDCRIDFILAIGVRFGLPSMLRNEAEVTASSIIDSISHLVVAEAVDLDGLPGRMCS